VHIDGSTVDNSATSAANRVCLTKTMTSMPADSSLLTWRRDIYDPDLVGKSSMKLIRHVHEVCFVELISYSCQRFRTSPVNDAIEMILLYRLHFTRNFHVTVRISPRVIRKHPSASC